MSGPVEVLAYLDARIASHKALSADAYHAQEVPKAEAVRAAVAELIAAASDPAVHVRGNGIRGWQRHCEAVARLRTALANAGGAK